MIANSHKAGKLPGDTWGVWSNPGQAESLVLAQRDALRYVAMKSCG